MNDLGKAKADSRLNPILKEVQKNFKIRFHQVEGPVWTSTVKGNIADIEYAPAKHPAACLAHELLHLVIQTHGYRRIRGGRSNKIPQLKRFIRCLDNELQHHKMFPHFVAAKFPPEHFYNDSDEDVSTFIVDELRRINEPVDAVILCFTILAPGGSLSWFEKETHLEALSSLDGGRFQNTVSGTKASLENWAATSSFNSEDTIRSICRSIAYPSESWFGYSEQDESSENGFFTDEI